MHDAALGSWGTLLFLGAFHGINPGMGWLFAVALGMQENRSDVVWKALLPLAIGHAAAIALVILAGVAAGAMLPVTVLRWPIAALLIALGIRQLVRHRHPRWGSMRIGLGGLAFWSFLVATAHGAGLMVLPVWLGSAAMSPSAHAAHMQATVAIGTGLEATMVHSASYLIVATLTAWIVFTRLGVGLLRKAWINMDAAWAVALIASGALAVFLE